jgi:hypothetical protein
VAGGAGELGFMRFVAKLCSDFSLDLGTKVGPNLSFQYINKGLACHVFSNGSF